MVVQTKNHGNSRPTHHRIIISNVGWLRLKMHRWYGVPNRSMLPNPAHIRGLGPASATDSRSDPSQLKHTVEVKAAAPLSFPSFSFFSFFSFFFFFFSWRETESNFYWKHDASDCTKCTDGFHCMKYPALIPFIFPFHISSPCCFWYFHRTFFDFRSASQTHSRI